MFFMHNAIVRIFATEITDPGAPGPRELVGQGHVGSDGTENGSNQIGSWEVTIEPLDDGVYSIVAETEDLAGNRSSSEARRIVIDSLAPNLPFLDLVETSDSGRHDSDDITNDNTPSVSMTTTDPDAGSS